MLGVNGIWRCRLWSCKNIIIISFNHAVEGLLVEVILGGHIIFLVIVLIWFVLGNLFLVYFIGLLLLTRLRFAFRTILALNAASKLIGIVDLVWTGYKWVLIHAAFFVEGGCSMIATCMKQLLPVLYLHRVLLLTKPILIKLIWAPLTWIE